MCLLDVSEFDFVLPQNAHPSTQIEYLISTRYCVCGIFFEEKKVRSQENCTLSLILFLIPSIECVAYGASVQKNKDSLFCDPSIYVKRIVLMLVLFFIHLLKLNI